MGDPAPWDPVLPGGWEDHLGGLTTAGPWSQSKKPKNTDPHDPYHETVTVVPSWPQTCLFPSLLQASGQGLQGMVWEEEQRDHSPNRKSLEVPTQPSTPVPRNL